MLALRLCNVNTSNLQHASRNGGKLRNAVAYVLPRGLGEAGQRLTIYSGVGARSKARSPNRVVGRFAAQLHQTRPKRRRLGRAGLERKDIGMGQKEALGLLTRHPIRRVSVEPGEGVPVACGMSGEDLFFERIHRRSRHPVGNPGVEAMGRPIHRR